MKQFYLLLTLLLLTLAPQAEEIVTLQLKNRPAVEVIPIIEPMLAAGDVITGHGFKIFLRSSKETLAQVREMLEAIDAAPKVLLISVLQASASELRSLGISADLSIGVDDVRANIDANARQQRLQNHPVHRLRVTEGSEGFIETGKQFALFSGAYSRSSSNTGFEKASTGFYVLPRVHGDNVTLQVSPFKTTASNTGGGSFNTQHAMTTISGRLGEWLLIGGVSEQATRSQSGTSGYSSTRGSSDASIWIKADLMR